MKNFASHDPEKYRDNPEYTPVEDGIHLRGNEYVTTLSFEQEPELGEGRDASYISPYPLEDLLDEFLVHISDSHDDLNVPGSVTCYQEFASPNLHEVRQLRSILGKRVYNADDHGHQVLVIEE